MDNEYKLGEIYLITCKSTGLQYVGAAQKYMGVNKQKWGTYGRWTRHCRDAFTENRPDYNVELHEAIRKYGKDDFEVFQICECLIENMYDLEQLNIIKYNTLHPNGYNMTAGGKNGKHCEESNLKKLNRNTNFSDEAKNNMSIGQIGKRYDSKERKNPEDKDLPKYVAAIRSNNVIVGYQVKKFPMGITEKEYIYKTFKNKSNPQVALEKATTHVKELEKQYKAKIEEPLIKKKEEEIKEKAIEMKLPEYMFPIFKDEILMGYSVSGLLDYENNPIPKRDFVNHTKNIDYEHALKFISLVKKMNVDKKTTSDWTIIDLPKKKTEPNKPLYIRKTTYKGEHNGYRVDFLTGYDDNKKPLLNIKCFTSKKLSLEEKYELAVQYVKELTIKYPNKKSGS